MPNPDPPAAAQQASPFDKILEQSCDLVCERLDQALAGMLDKVEESLTALINETQNQETQVLYRETRDKVLAQRKSIEDSFRTRYLREFQTRSNRVRKIGQSFSEFDLSALELDLVGEDDLDETLKFNNVAAKLRRFCDEELVALDQRVGVLLGDADLQAEDNPFSPQAICDAYKYTCRQVDSNIKLRMVLLKLFDDHVVDAIRSIYKDVNALLVKNSILPKIRYGVSRQEGGKAPAAGAHADDEAPGTEKKAADKAAGSEQDFFSVLQSLLAKNPQATAQLGAAGSVAVPGAGGVQVVLQGADLLNSLTRIQQGNVSAMTASDGQTVALPALGGEAGTTNVLRELKSSNVGAGMGQMDAMTLDIVAMLFDQLFDEPKIPISVKGLIGRMQIPMLKVAITDKAFFSQKTHPARQLLNTLGEIAVRLPAEFNSSSPLFGRLETIIQELMNGFQDNLEIFDTTRERLQALIAEEDKRAEQETEATAKRIEQQESLALAKATAQDEIKARIKAHKGSRFVHAFLVQHWVKFLLLVHVKRGKDSDAWKSSIEAMDQLCWSVEPKNTIEERRKLATVVPGMLKRLTTGLKVAGVDEAASARFFAELMKRHTEVMGKEEKTAAQETAAASSTAKPHAAPASKEPAKPAPAEPGKAPVPTEAKTATRISAPTPKEAAKAAPAAPGKPPAPGVAKATGVKPAPAAKEAAKPAPPTPAKPAAPSPAETGDSESLDFTSTITVRNPFGGGQVQVDEVNFADLPGASPTQARQAAKDAELTGKLAEGTWVEIREKSQGSDEETRRPARLSYISPMKNSYLFVDRQGKTALECSRAELARRMRLGNVVIMDEAPLFDRIMGGLVGKLGGAAAPH